MAGIGGLVIPSPAASTRADELWRHTCFEAFLRPSPGEAYVEFNFSPSTQWAAYRFSGVRSGRRNTVEIGAPSIELRRNAECFELRVHLKLEGLPDFPGDSAWRLGLSAVVEEAGGRQSYWALAHPPGKADFHHSDCFALELPAAWQV
ncbi:MAG TPA: DOMON-like domain-containing protein [Rhizomicrobium sp.]